MANILTASEAATVLRCESDDANMLALLPQVDAYIEQATGRAWQDDTTIRAEAKSAARMLMVRWHEDPGGLSTMLGPGLTAALTQLEALAVAMATEGVPAEALSILAMHPAIGASDIAISTNIIIVFNHELASATTGIALKNSAGATVATTNALDGSGKILSINPNSNLTAAATYTISLADVADVYGLTITDDFRFTTA